GEEWVEVGPKNKVSTTRRQYSCLAKRIRLQQSDFGGPPPMFFDLPFPVPRCRRLKTESKDSPITRIFGGVFRSTLKAAGQKDSVTFEPFQTLQLDVTVRRPSIADSCATLTMFRAVPFFRKARAKMDGVNSVDDALRILTQPEIIDNYTVKHAKVQAQKQVLIDQAPPVLVLQLKRFMYTPEGGYMKNTKPFRYPPVQNVKSALTPAAAGSPRSRTYVLTAGLRPLRIPPRKYAQHGPLPLRRAGPRRVVRAGRRARVQDRRCFRLRDESLPRSVPPLLHARGLPRVDLRRAGADFDAVVVLVLVRLGLCQRRGRLAEGAVPPAHASARRKPSGEAAAAASVDDNDEAFSAPAPRPPAFAAGAAGAAAGGRGPGTAPEFSTPHAQASALRLLPVAGGGVRPEEIEKRKTREGLRPPTPSLPTLHPQLSQSTQKRTSACQTAPQRPLSPPTHTHPPQPYHFLLCKF
ncbi:MAG: hypothetical protein BJ554DRAFT_4463, partial [Olpidium bornovanus]